MTTTDMTTNPAVLEKLIADIEAVVATGGTEEQITAEVAKVLDVALTAGLALTEAVTRPNAKRYVMYPLYIAPDESFCIASAVWNVGQTTPIHGHEVWGVVGIYSGSERELRFAFPDPNITAPVELLDDEVWGPGQVTVCCTTDQDIHKVSAATDEPCIGIHVYGGNIGEIKRKTYDPETGEIGYFTSFWAEPVDA